MRTLVTIVWILLCACVEPPTPTRVRPEAPDASASTSTGDEAPSSEVPNSEIFETIPSAAEIVQVDIDDVLKRVTITRPVRSASTIVSRMSTLVGLVGSGTFRSNTELTAWANAAKAAPGSGAGMQPLNGVVDVHVHYEPYFDDLTVENIARVSYRPAVLDTPVDYGIGQAAARTKANATVISMKSSGILASAWGSTPAREYSVRRDVAFENPEESYAWERMYMFVYRRSYDGFPVLDAKLEIGIGAHENPANVAYIRIGDVTVVASSPNMSADISTDDARTEFISQSMAAEDPVPDELLIAEEFVGYMLDPREATGAIYPRFHASYETLTGGVVSHGKGASLSLTEILFFGGFERQLHFPWEGASPNPAPRPNGELCVGGGQCASGRCFFAGAFGGVCGQCSSDLDCPTNKVCDHPRLQDGQWLPSACVTPVLGSGCSTASRCGVGLTCQTLFYSPALYNVRTCSTCNKDADCPSGNVCSPTIDIDAMVAKQVCVIAGSEAIDSACKDNNECASGLCAAAPIGNLGTVGICSKCDDDDDCSGAQTCNVATASVLGFSGGVCE
jgi:hypothetical protein